MQKGNPVTLPLGSIAPVLSNGGTISAASSNGGNGVLQVSGSNVILSGSPLPGNLIFGNPTGLYADLSTATSATINAIRQAVQTQRFLERDARGGTRYIELLNSHFGVVSPDARLQRPEYIGGGSTPINLNPIAQTSGSNATGTTTPLGNLAAMGTMVSKPHGFQFNSTEHGYIIGIVSVRADLSYQQGLRRMWSRSTRYDFAWPVFANLGEQAVLNKEIYVTGNSTQDNAVFGYQERFAEYRYIPSIITGLMRSTSSGTIDPWHLAQKFTALPTLSPSFIEENPPLSRVLAVGSSANGQQFFVRFCFSWFYDTSTTYPCYSGYDGSFLIY